ncbi:AAA family ATPase [Haloechinothrix sp. LS1_15]|nr:AAA family ATPase [Haloechinothrix sp. LS1_15]
MLHGRSREQATIDAMLTSARNGHSATLVIRGDAGIGKSALLDYAAHTASDMRVLRGAGVESESELPFAGLHLLLSGHLDRLDALPDKQAQALRGALGMAPVAGSDRFLIGLAVLTLLADIAEEQPLLCLIDDAHWLDHASAEALMFTARRLHADGIVLLFAARDLHAPAFPAHGLPELRLTELDGDAASALLDECAGDLPHHARSHILQEAHGNPLALLELPAAQREGQLTPYSPAVRPQAPRSRIQHTFAERIRSLPEATQALLTVAAADDTGDPSVILPAAAAFGASLEDLEPAERKHLMHYVDGSLAFRHPLIRTAAYQHAPLRRRLEAHRALADALRQPEQADRRAWHRAAVSTGPDEEVAAELDATAEHARARAGYGAVAAAYERAAMLSTDAHQRANRLLAAAAAAADAGQLERADTLASQASEHLDDPVAGARLASIRATIAEERHQPDRAHQLLATAGVAVARHDPKAADALLYRSVDSAMAACDIDAVTDVARRSAPLPLDHPSRAAAMATVAAGFHSTDAGTVGQGVAALRELVSAERPRLHELPLRDAPLVPGWQLMLGDDEDALTVAGELTQRCRDEGAIGVLPLALSVLTRAQLYLGHHHDALASGMEGLRIAEDTGQSLSGSYLTSALADLAAIQGDGELVTSLTAESVARGQQPDNVLVACSLSVLDLGLGRYEAILGRLAELGTGLNRTFSQFYLPYLIEAAVRAEQPERATEPLAWYRAWAEHSGNSWACAVAARCQALLAGDSDGAREHFTTATELHRQSPGRPFERARTELLFGEWLRRNRARGEAREQLRSALAIFQRLGAAPWIERTTSELRATGETVNSRGNGRDLLDKLTPQELQVVRLAATGLSNREIAAQLFLSPRTVGYHLYNAYPKLGVSSRVELGQLDLAD